MAIFSKTSMNVSVSCAPLMPYLSLTIVNGTPLMPRSCAFLMPAWTDARSSSDARNALASSTEAKMPVLTASRARSSCEPGSPDSSKYVLKRLRGMRGPSQLESEDRASDSKREERRNERRTARRAQAGPPRP